MEQTIENFVPTVELVLEEVVLGIDVHKISFQISIPRRASLLSPQMVDVPVEVPSLCRTAWWWVTFSSRLKTFLGPL